MTEAERAAFWRGKRVLVTGGAGFLGSGLCHALAALGARVTALDAMSEEGGANLVNLQGASVLLVRGDIRDVELHSLCAGTDVLFNMAAQTSHMGGQRDPGGRHRHQRRGAGAADRRHARGGAERDGGPRLHPPVLRPPAAPAGRRAAPGAAAGRQRRLQMGGRAVLAAGAAGARAPRGVAPPDQLLRPAAPHPGRAADLPRHLDPPRAGRRALRGLGRRAAPRPRLSWTTWCAPSFSRPRRRRARRWPGGCSTSAARRRPACATSRSG